MSTTYIAPLLFFSDAELENLDVTSNPEEIKAKASLEISISSAPSLISSYVAHFPVLVLCVNFGPTSPILYQIPDITLQSFTDYELNSQLIDRLQALGYSKPFSIQSATLPYTLKGNDVIGKAVTGSGKSLAFTLPILHRLSEQPRTENRPLKRHGTRHPRAIIISPTRELCLQSHTSLQQLCPSHMTCVAVYGGASINKQMSEMSRGVDIICATPGRLNDLLKRNAIALDDVCFICLDEADELLTPNFKDQIEWVLRNSPDGKQMMLFSATMPTDVRRVADEFMSKGAEFVDITKGQRYSMPTSVEHQCMRVYGSHYNPVIEKLLEEHNPEKCIIFCETKRDTSRMAETLKSRLRIEALHSDLSQARRDAIMNKFRKGHVNILVATDVAARGLDVPEIDLVIQAGTPKNGSEYYVHRSGRTGRAGRSGLSILLHTGDKRDRFIIHEIEKIVKMNHVECSNFKELQQMSITRMCESLQTMRLGHKEIDTLTPVVAEFDDQTKSSMLISALAEKLRASNVNLSSPAGGRDRHRVTHGHRDHAHDHRQRSYNGRNRPRNLSDDYDNDDDGDNDYYRGESQFSRRRSSTRGQGHRGASGDPYYQQQSFTPSLQNNRYADHEEENRGDGGNLRYSRPAHQNNSNNNNNANSANDEQDVDFGSFVSKMQRR